MITIFLTMIVGDSLTIVKVVLLLHYSCDSFMIIAIVSWNSSESSPQTIVDRWPWRQLV